MRLLRAIVRRTAEALAAGVLVTVLVSWGIAMWAPMPILRPTVGTPQRQWRGAVPATWSPIPKRELGGQKPWIVTQQLRSSTLESVAGYLSEVQYTRVDVGLPWPSLSYDHLKEGPAVTTQRARREVKSGWTVTELPIWRRGLRLERVARYRRIPLLPVWPGFLLNTLTYAGLAAFLWWVPGAARRTLRRRRGRCQRCGYDLRGSADGACPECGSAPRPSHR